MLMVIGVSCDKWQGGMSEQVGGSVTREKLQAELVKVHDKFSS